MIRFVCPSCQSKLNAKDELAGQRRKCPKCGSLVQIPSEPDLDLQAADEAAQEAAPSATGGEPGEQLVHDLREDGLATGKTPETLNRSNIYLVCDKTRIFAIWQNDGQGWMLKTNTGPQSAKRNSESIPAHGDFTLIELVMQERDEGRHLGGISVFELPKRWALPSLARGDNAIFRKVVGSGGLSREQKLAVRRQLEELFMPEIWHENRTVIDYLSGDVYHSPGTG